ncbi:MAG TPA: flavin reductase family protein [Streptosporangiaceae bacterium]|nr:flavin reductase family protein [Streptosporangiaceae bacterium]
MSTAISTGSGQIRDGQKRDGQKRDGQKRNGLREALRCFATGVTVLSAGRDTPCGMTANAFTSVSLSPPLVLVCVKHDAAIHQAVLESGSFAVSVLSARQAHVARYFADHSRPRGRGEFDYVGWTPGPNTGAPVIDGTLAWIECALAEVHEGGDHSIFLGSVLASRHGPACDALVFFGGRFHCPPLSPPETFVTADLASLP